MPGVPVAGSEKEESGRPARPLTVAAPIVRPSVRPVIPEKAAHPCHAYACVRRSRQWFLVAGAVWTVVLLAVVINLIAA